MRATRWIPAVAALAMVLLGALWWVVARDAAPAAPVAEPEVIRAPMPPRAAPAKPNRVRLSRPSEHPRSAEPESVQPDHPALVPEPPPPVRIALEDLTEAQRAALFSRSMEALEELVRACGEYAQPDTHVASQVVLDAQGLLEMELFAYRGDLENVEEDLDTVLPDALVDCLDDAIWDRDWPTVEAGTELPLALTMPIAGEPE